MRKNILLLSAVFLFLLSCKNKTDIEVLNGKGELVKIKHNSIKDLSFDQYQEISSMSASYLMSDKMKLGGSTDATPIKEKFKAMMLQNGALTSKGDQIWAIISTRATILTELDVQTKSEFILHISNTSNKFYDFIYVK